MHVDDVEALTVLRAAGADPRDAEGAPLPAAAEYGHGAAVRQLLVVFVMVTHLNVLLGVAAAQVGHEDVGSLSCWRRGQTEGRTAAWRCAWRRRGTEGGVAR